MGFSVNEIIAQINKNFLAKPHLYEVRIFARQPVNDASREVMFNCASITIPGKNVQMIQERRYGVGLNYNVVENKTFSEVIMGFYESEFEKERRYFSEWVDNIIDPVNYRVKYYKDYVRDIEIIQYNNKKEVVYTAMLRDCIPANIAPLDRGYDKSESVPIFNVNIQFHDVEETFFQRTV